MKKGVSSVQKKLSGMFAYSFITQINSLSHTYSLSLTHTHTHTHTLSLSLSLSLSPEAIQKRHSVFGGSSSSPDSPKPRSTAHSPGPTGGKEPATRLYSVPGGGGQKSEGSDVAKNGEPPKPPVRPSRKPKPPGERCVLCVHE